MPLSPPAHHRRGILSVACGLVVALAMTAAHGWDPIPVVDDPLVRMPGTQPDDMRFLDDPQGCQQCHLPEFPDLEPIYSWQGSMMAQAGRDPLFWAAMTVALQDSVWLLGTPNAGDLCLRCHMPKGWLEGRSDAGSGPNGSTMTSYDFDGVQCGTCHRQIDPFFQDTIDRIRECVGPGCTWADYWDEATDVESDALVTHAADEADAATIEHFDGTPFYDGTNHPVSPDYTENGGGQYFVSSHEGRRASFADAGAPHEQLYSRHHKSRYFCASCHDVSNPILVNMGADPGQPLPSETDSAFSYAHVERTFSELMLSDYGLDGGAPGVGPFAPEVFDTSMPNDWIARCQDCHMADWTGKACDQGSGVFRPDDSVDHPNSGVPRHDLTGANVLVSRILASTVPFSPNYDPVNETLLGQGPAVLTLDLTEGLGIDPVALLDGADRALQNLADAAAFEAVGFDPSSRALAFRVRNHTGHKLISGYPEGRRMWVNVRLFDDGALVHEINPYDEVVDTLRGVPTSPIAPPLGEGESYVDELVYEMHGASSFTGEGHTLHFVLSDSRVKDNRIPPPGFRIAEAAARLAEPVWEGVPDPAYFTAAEYAGGYDEVTVTLPERGDRLELRLYYQTTTREYVEFLRDEINGVGTLPPGPTPSGEPEPYIAQTDPFFSQLAAWGDTIWNLWDHNRDVPGAAPIEMTSAVLDLAIFRDGFESGNTGAWAGGG